MIIIFLKSILISVLFHSKIYFILEIVLDFFKSIIFSYRKPLELYEFH